MLAQDSLLSWPTANTLGFSRPRALLLFLSKRMWPLNATLRNLLWQRYAVLILTLHSPRPLSFFTSHPGMLPGFTRPPSSQIPPRLDQERTLDPIATSTKKLRLEATPCCIVS